MKFTYIIFSVLVCSHYVEFCTGKINGKEEQNQKTDKPISKKSHDGDKSDGLLSKKSSKSAEECDASTEKCMFEKTKNNMMDNTADVFVETLTKYAKDFSEGKLDWKQLMASDYFKQISNLLMHGNLPGGNALISSAFQLFQKVMATFATFQQNVKKDGLNLKTIVDEANALVSQIVPGLIITLEHADRHCRKQALCRAAHASVQSPHDLAKSFGLLLSSATATYTDHVEKSKKKEYIKVVECCSIADKAIFEKCSKKYVDEKVCTTHRMLNPKLLQPIPYSELEVLKNALPNIPLFNI